MKPINEMGSFPNIDYRLIPIARKNNQMSQVDLARSLCVTQAHVSGIERGGTRISMNLGKALYGIFGDSICIPKESNILLESVKAKLESCDQDFLEWLEKTIDYIQLRK
jgi:transcriptional regulator with XRE-family HTH domain